MTEPSRENAVDWRMIELDRQWLKTGNRRACSPMEREWLARMDRLIAALDAARAEQRERDATIVRERADLARDLRPMVAGALDSAVIAILATP